MKLLLSEEKTLNSSIIDPRTKFFLMILVSSVIFGSINSIILFTISSILVSMMLLSGKWKGVFFLGLYILALLIMNDFVIFNSIFFNACLKGIFAVIIKIGPSIMLGYYIISTTELNQLIAAMSKIKCPIWIIIPISVIFRFIPKIYEESKNIKEGLESRGLETSFFYYIKKPLTYIKYRWLPLLFSVIRIGEELSASVITRGLNTKRKRSSYSRLELKKIDYFYFMLIFVVFILRFSY